MSDEPKELEITFRVKMTEKDAWKLADRLDMVRHKLNEEKHWDTSIDMPNMTVRSRSTYERGWRSLDEDDDVPDAICQTCGNKLRRGVKYPGQKNEIFAWKHNTSIYRCHACFMKFDLENDPKLKD